MNRLSRFVKKFDDSQSLGTLPLIHTTDAYSFRSIIDNGMVLSPRLCQVFREEILYLFYGKSGYSRKRQGSSSLLAFFPVFFLIASSAVIATRRILPSDSGAFEGQLYKTFFDKHYTISAFVIDCDYSHSGGIAFPQTAMLVVSAFYGNNKNYYYNQPRRDILVSPLDFEAEALMALNADKGDAEFDDRRIPWAKKQASYCRCLSVIAFSHVR